MLLYNYFIPAIKLVKYLLTENLKKCHQKKLFSYVFLRLTSYNHYTYNLKKPILVPKLITKGIFFCQMILLTHEKKYCIIKKVIRFQKDNVQANRLKTGNNMAKKYARFLFLL